MPSSDTLTLDATDISLIALGISALAFLWSVGWALWLDRRATRAQATVRASLAVSEKTGVATVLNIIVTNGPHRPITIRRVSIEPKDGPAFDVALSSLAVPSHSSTALGAYDEWHGSIVLGMLWRQAPGGAASDRFRVRVHHDGRSDRSDMLRLA